MTPLAAHPEFLAFCAHWEAGGVCPLPLADWLRDRGLDDAADAVLALPAPRLEDHSRDRHPPLLAGTPATALWLWDRGDLPAEVYDRLPLAPVTRFAGGWPLAADRLPAFPSFAAAALALLAPPPQSANW